MLYISLLTYTRVFIKFVDCFVSFCCCLLHMLMYVGCMTVCLPVCRYTFTWRSKCMCVCVYSHGGPTSIFLYHFYPMYWGKVSCWMKNSVSAGQFALEIAWLCLQCAWVAKGWHAHMAFTCVLGITLSHPSNPSCSYEWNHHDTRKE